MFPTRYVVNWFAYDDNGVQDGLGNDEPAWLPAVPRKVIGWKPSTTENTEGFESREVTDVLMEVPRAFTYTAQDRCQFPGSTDLYEVVGGVDNGGGFHGWNPARLIRLRLVKN